jgi:hypothetical protein
MRKVERLSCVARIILQNANESLNIGTNTQESFDVGMSTIFENVPKNM